jgi:hypothetical protein
MQCRSTWQEPSEKGAFSEAPGGLAQTNLSPEDVVADFGDSEAIGIQGTQ